MGVRSILRLTGLLDRSWGAAPNPVQRADRTKCQLSHAVSTVEADPRSRIELDGPYGLTQNYHSGEAAIAILGGVAVFTALVAVAG